MSEEDLKDKTPEEEDKDLDVVRRMLAVMHKKQREQLLDKMTRRYLKGYIVWDSRKGTYKKDLHGKFKKR